MSARLQWTALLVVMVGTSLIRMSMIGEPPLAEAQWKEIDYITISSNFQAHGFNIFRPEVTWPAEPPRFTEMEFPLVPWLTAWLYLPAGLTPVAVRALPLLCWLGLVVVIFLLSRRELGPLIGLGVAAGTATFPLLNPFGTTLQSEPAAVLGTACAVWFAVRWADDQRTSDLVLAGVSLSMTILLKIEAAWIVLPMAVAVLRRHGRSGAVWRQAILASALAMVPVAGWYAWAYHLEVTGAHVFGIFRGHNKLQFTTLLLEPSWWLTMAYRLKQFSGGPVGLLIVLAGFLVLSMLQRRGAVFLSWGLGIVAYSLIVAEGQIDAPYRQLYAVPVLAVLFALGVAAGVTALTVVWKSGQLHAGVMLVPLVVIPWLVLPGAIPRSEPDSLRWEAARTIAEHSMPGDTIVVAGEYDPKEGGNDLSPLLYYYANRQGWTLQPGECTLQRVEELAGRGADLFVELPPFASDELTTCSDGVRAELMDRYEVLHEGEYVILDVSPKV